MSLSVAKNPSYRDVPYVYDSDTQEEKYTKECVKVARNRKRRKLLLQFDTFYCRAEYRTVISW